MLIDSRSLQTKQIDTDICIVGAGPAGISLALELVGENSEVTLLESGGLEFDSKTQELADGKVFGDSIVPPITACNRQFGGNSHLWYIKIRESQLGLRHVPFDEIDFEKRDWVPHSGWPFNREHLKPYYERAQVICQAGPFTYEVSSWENNCRQRLPLDDKIIETGMFQFGPADVFHKKYCQELKAASNVRIFTNANVVEIITNESGRVANQLRVASLGGKEFRVSAKVFILACGGFENARLLLMSNQQQSVGLGNQYDVVGRYYHDHPEIIGGYLFPKDRNLFNKIALYDLRQVNGTPVMGFLRLSRKILEQEKLLNSNTMLYPRPNQRQTQAIESLKYLLEVFPELFQQKSKPSLQKKFKLFDNLPGKLLNITMGLDSIAKAIYLAKWKKQSLIPYLCHDGWTELRDNTRVFKRFEVRHLIEQSPDPDNRVKLSSERDVLGCQKLELHWRWQRDDAESFARSLDLISRELHRAGLGEFHTELDHEGLPKPTRPIGSHHLMGTTRMHDNPRQGVVDSDCRVHGMMNLFITGSSTFPTGGYANPTLTIVAMSLRLADLIKKTLL